MSEKKPRDLHIILAEDGSDHARAASDLLLDLSLTPNSHIDVVSVFNPTDPIDETELQHELDQFAEPVKASPIPFDTHLIPGHPAEIIVEYADRIKPDLIALGARGLHTTFGILLGGIAQQVVEYANYPVLVVRAPYQGIKQVLLVVDGSEHNQRAVRYLCASDEHGCFPFSREAIIQIVHVMEPVRIPAASIQQVYMGPDLIIEKRLEAAAIRQSQLEQEGKYILSQASQALKASGAQTKTILLKGDPAEEILRYAENEKVDLIVAGSRGLSQVKSWLMGSVSRKLVHYAKCSVLIVK